MNPPTAFHSTPLHPTPLPPQPSSLIFSPPHALPLLAHLTSNLIRTRPLPARCIRRRLRPVAAFARLAYRYASAGVCDPKLVIR